MKLSTAISPAFGVAILLLGLSIGCSEVAKLSSHAAQQSEADEPVFDPHVVIPTPFPAIKKTNIESVEKASMVLGDGELVLGVSIDGESRAYPITMLCGPTREIINDVLGDTKFAATW